MPRPLPVVLLLLVGFALAMAGCGASTTLSASGSPKPQAIAYLDCMRSHGVPNLPDPGPEGGIQLGSSSGINASSPAFRTAQTRCAKLLPRGGPGGLGPSSKRTEERLLALSKCMRAHGVSGFPDPTLGPPPSNPQEFSIAMGTGGVSLLVPKTIDVSSPAFAQAAAACHFGSQVGNGHRTPAP
jgi:hypothetical protein